MKIDPMYFTTVPFVCIKFMEKFSKNKKQDFVENDIERLRILFEHSVISKDEFDVMKRRILDKE